jgi:hypothetical protein
MARLARVIVPGPPHHVTQIGNRRQPIFFAERDQAVYRALLAEQLRGARRGLGLLSDAEPCAPEPGDEASLGRAVGEAHRRDTSFVNAMGSRYRVPNTHQYPPRVVAVPSVEVSRGRTGAFAQDDDRAEPTAAGSHRPLPRFRRLIVAAASRNSVLRTALAFLIAPAVPLLALWLLGTLYAGTAWLGELSWGFGVMTIFVYPFVVVLGIPAFFVLRALRWTSLPAYVAAGAGLGVALTLLVLGGLHDTAWLALCSVSAMVAAACFWLIARPDRASVSERPAG